MTRYVVVGGGIVGLATARALLDADPAGQLTLLEKEAELARHQTGRNSGVIHSGIYYPPGSAKALMCRAGAESMIRFADEHSIPMIRTGKLIVATKESELPGLHLLHERGLANGIEVSLLGPDQAREHEPFVHAIAALRVAATAITDYSAVCRALAAELTAAGVQLRLGVTVTGLAQHGGVTTVQTDAGTFTADVLVNCAGLHADRLAAKDTAPGAERVDSQIVPFRGEYYELRPEARYLVKGLIYPVPDPEFPFLGVHLTRMVDGSVHAGPNAVLALAREGYDWHTIRPADVAAVLRFGGFWRLARNNLGAGLMEVARSLSTRRFAASLARLVPDLTAADLVPSHAGVRAQALRSDGRLVDDFLIVARGHNVHVL
ncbi:MAG: L-2-hydroxyglutarate oxidase, partial [Jatrophihabitans sp.]